MNNTEDNNDDGLQDVGGPVPWPTPTVPSPGATPSPISMAPTATSTTPPSLLPEEPPKSGYVLYQRIELWAFLIGIVLWIAYVVHRDKLCRCPGCDDDNDNEDNEDTADDPERVQAATTASATATATTTTTATAPVTKSPPAVDGNGV